MKIASIVGARPQFIKATPLSRELREKHEEVLIHTGQHYDYGMSKIFFDELGIPEPDYNLEVGSGTHGYQTGEMLRKLEEVLIKENPGIALVYGDTNSTLGGALASTKLHIKLGHIEAGLRSYDKNMPEEINRVLTDHISDYLFCPTKVSVENLKKEGIKNGVYLVGDVMYDSLIYNIKIAEKKSEILKKLELNKKDYLLLTIHRAENTNNVENIVKILNTLSQIDEKVIFPVHPRTKNVIEKYKIKISDNIVLIEPLSYLDFIKLEKYAKKILTDSGGIQKEAYILKVPCITLRDRTEWIETVEDGWNVLVGRDENKIINAVKNFDPKEKQRNVYGDGRASEKIVGIIGGRE
ncbi:MAG TPA: UDP-N-acetylglucosamine 2-epimerase (non-hydrolyzing) [Candidatus Atribacteria bacterium]|nr:UDP-N-acetylglucosamine 2-epimerase (non-hydrolyzing) [Candidatus Atribacteria bacterium]